MVVVDEGDTDEPDMRLKMALLGSAPDEKIIALCQRFRSQNDITYQIDPRTDYFTAAHRHLDGLYLWVFVTCLPQPFFLLLLLLPDVGWALTLLLAGDGGAHREAERPVSPGVARVLPRCERSAARV